jgi:hypothetical protein
MLKRGIRGQPSRACKRHGAWAPLSALFLLPLVYAVSNSIKLRKMATTAVIRNGVLQADVRDIGSGCVIRHRKRMRVYLKFRGEIRGRDLTRGNTAGPLPFLTRNEVLAEHLHPVVLLKALDVDGRVGRWRIGETEPNASGAPGTYPAHCGQIARPTTCERDRFCGSGGAGCASSGWDVWQRRGADILNTKAA